MLFHFYLGFFLCLGAQTTAHDCDELGDLSWSIYQKLLRHYPLHGFVSGPDVMGKFLCDLSDAKNMTEFVEIFARDTPFQLGSQIRPFYNSLAAYLREKRLGGAQKEISMYLKFSTKLDEWAFPVYPLNVSKEEIISFIQEAFKELGPNAIDRVTRGRFPEPKFVLYTAKEVDTFAKAFAESNSTLELANNLGWDLIDVKTFASSFSTGDKLNLIKEIIPDLLKLMDHLHKDGFFNINHRDPKPFGDPVMTPECQELGEKLFALKDFTMIPFTFAGPVSFFYTDKPEYLLGEFLQLDVENKGNWTAAACWLQGLSSMKEINTKFHLPPGTDVPKIHQKLSTMNDDDKLNKFILNMGVLLPIVQRRGLPNGLPNFPVKFSYGEIYSTVKYLVKTVGPDFMNYFRGPMFSSGPKFNFEPITDVAYVAGAYLEAKNVSDLARRLNVTLDEAKLLEQPIMDPVIFIYGDRYLSMSRLMATVLESLRAIGFFEIKA